jgi:Tol biopolymer transport system component
MRRLTLEGRNHFPVWSPDGRSLAFQSDRNGDRGVFLQRADGTSAADQLTKPEPGTSHVPESWSPDGRTLMVAELKGDTFTLMTLSLADRTLTRFGDARSILDPPAAAFSPDGRWVAYLVNDVGLEPSSQRPFHPLTSSM